MISASRVPTLAAALLVAACGAPADPAANEAAPNVADNRSEPAAAAAPTAAPAATAYRLHADGIEPGLTFGMKQADAIAAAQAAFGPAGKLEHNDECGEGPMDFVSFGGLQLGFQEGKLAGWSLSEAVPGLRTKSGLAIGAPRASLAGLEIDRDSTLGPEFDADGVGGLLDEKESRIVALWAGYPCQFR